MSVVNRRWQQRGAKASLNPNFADEMHFSILIYKAFRKTWTSTVRAEVAAKKRVESGRFLVTLEHFFAGGPLIRIPA